MGLDNFLLFWFKISFATWVGAAGGFFLRQEFLHPAISQINLGQNILHPLILGGITGTIAAVLTVVLGLVMGVKEIQLRESVGTVLALGALAILVMF